MTVDTQSIRTILEAAQGTVKADVTIRLWDDTTVEYHRSDAPSIEVAIPSGK